MLFVALPIQHIPSLSHSLLSALSPLSPRLALPPHAFLSFSLSLFLSIYLHLVVVVLFLGRPCSFLSKAPPPPKKKMQKRASFSLDTDRQTDRQMRETSRAEMRERQTDQTDRPMNGRTDGWAHGQIETNTKAKTKTKTDKTMTKTRETGPPHHR